MQLFFPIVISAQSMQLTLKSAGQKGNVAVAHIPAAAQRCEGMNCDAGKQTLPRGVCRGPAPVCASVGPTLGCQQLGGNLLSWCHQRGKDRGVWAVVNVIFAGKVGGSRVWLCNVAEELYCTTWEGSDGAGAAAPSPTPTKACSLLGSLQDKRRV